MASVNLSRIADSISDDEIRFRSLQQTPNFRGGGFAVWNQATLGVFGAGVLGFRLGEEAVLSGAQVLVVDPDIGESANLGTQLCRAGVAKAQALVDRCDATPAGVCSLLRVRRAPRRHSSAVGV